MRKVKKKLDVNKQVVKVVPPSDLQEQINGGKPSPPPPQPPSVPWC